MKRRRLVLVVLLTAGWLAGCQGGSVTRPGDIGGLISPTARDRIVDTIAPPPGIEADLIEPLQGEELAQARLSLDRVLRSLPRPAFLDVAPSPRPKPEEPPLAAQKAYVQALEAWHAGDSTKAKQQLEAALRLAPKQPTLLRILGEVYTRTGNRVRGAQYFRQAVELEPEDAHSLYILGRFAIEKGDHAEAVVLFHEAMLRAGDNTALKELAHHFLGNALRQLGYLAAAIEQFEQYLSMIEHPAGSSRFRREQFLLRRQVGTTYQLLGDLYLRLDQPKQAYEAYQHALEAGVVDPIKLDKRLIHTALRLKDGDLARSLVIDLVKRLKGDAQAIAMVRYVVTHGLNTGAIAAELASLYESQGRPAQLAIAAADVMPDEQAKALLIAHLREKPGDRDVFQRLIRYELLPVESAPFTPETLRQAVSLTLDLMSRAPALADNYGSTLVQQVRDIPGLLAVIDSLDPAETDPAMQRVLRGLCFAVQSDMEQALSEFEQAVQQSPDLAVARIELAKALIVRKDYDRAAEVLEPLAGSNDPSVILLRANVLSQTGKEQRAVELIDRVIRQTGGDVRLVITKANLQLKLGQPEQAEQTLLDALNADPTAEPIYEALLNLYDPPIGRASPIKDSTAKWRILVKRLLGTIPNSRTGRLVQAQLYDASQNYERAAAILEGLLTENPDDTSALHQLLETYHAAGRTGEAIARLESRLEARAQDTQLLQIAMQFYSKIGDRDRLFAVQERTLLLEPDTPERSARLGYLYTQWGRYQQAIDVLESALQQPEVANPVALVSLLAQAREQAGQLDEAEQTLREAAQRFNEHEAELNYLLAVTLINRGQREQGEQIMRETLAKHPDHGPSNNGLGYAMLMRNEAPDKALVMIQRAVDSEPENEAYTDSLGWAYYKLGRFEDAEVWLRKARDLAIKRLQERRTTASATLAIINDHLGDTLYRLGRENEALRSWAEAGSHLRAATPEDLKQDPELASLQQRLQAKIRALRAKQEVPVAEVAVTTPPATEPAPGPEPKQPPSEAPTGLPETSKQANPSLAPDTQQPTEPQAPESDAALPDPPTQTAP